MAAVFILICTAVFRSRAGLSLSRLRMEPRAFLQLWYRLAPTCFLGELHEIEKWRHSDK